jgi:hypothetical protein
VNRLALFEWDFDHLDIGDSAADAVADAIEASNGLRKVQLRGCNLSITSLDRILNALANCAKLTSIDLRGTVLGDEGARLVADFLERSQTVEQVNLSECDLGLSGRAVLQNIFSAMDRFLYINFSPERRDALPTTTATTTSHGSSNNSNYNHHSNQPSRNHHLHHGGNDNVDDSNIRNTSMQIQTPHSLHSSAPNPLNSPSLPPSSVEPISPSIRPPEILTPPELGSHVPLHAVTTDATLLQAGAAVNGAGVGGGRRRGYTFKMYEKPAFDPTLNAYPPPDTGRRGRQLGKVLYSGCTGEVLADGRIRGSDGSYYTGPAAWVSSVDGANSSLDAPSTPKPMTF